MHPETHVDKRGRKVVKYVNNEEVLDKKKVKTSNNSKIFKAVRYFTFDDHTLTDEEIKKGEKSPFLSMSVNERNNIYNPSIEVVKTITDDKGKVVDVVTRRDIAIDWMSRFVFRVIGNAKYTRKPNVDYLSENHHSIIFDNTQFSPYARGILNKAGMSVHKMSESDQASIIQLTNLRMLELIYGYYTDNQKKLVSQYQVKQNLLSLPHVKQGIKLDNNGNIIFSDKIGGRIEDKSEYSEAPISKKKFKKNHKEEEKIDELDPMNKKDPANKVIWGYMANVLKLVAKEVLFQKNRGGDRMGHTKDGVFVDDLSVDDMIYGDKNYNTPSSPSAEESFFDSEEKDRALVEEEKHRQKVREAEAEIDKRMSEHPARQVGESIIDGKKTNQNKARDKIIWNMYLDNQQKFGNPKHKEITNFLKENGYPNVSEHVTRQVVKNITSKLEQTRWKDTLPGRDLKEDSKPDEVEDGVERGKVIPPPLKVILHGKSHSVVLSDEYIQHLSSEEKVKAKPQIIHLTTLPSFNKQSHSTLKSSHVNLESREDNTIGTYRDRGNVKVQYFSNRDTSGLNHYLLYYKSFADSDGDTNKIFVYTKKIVEKVPTAKKTGKEKATSKKGSSPKKSASKKKSTVKKGKVWRGFVARLKQIR